MRATATELADNRVRLAVEVDDDEMTSALDAAAAALAKRVSIKGFRSGHVPRNVLVAHLGGPEALRAEAIREALPDFYARAVADTSIDPIGQPAITVTAGEDDGALAFDAEVEVRPEVDLVGYRELRVTIPSPQVTDDEVDEQVDRYRETDATLHEVDRPIASGDLVTMDLTVTRVASDDEPVKLTRLHVHRRLRVDHRGGRRAHRGPARGRGPHGQRQPRARRRRHLRDAPHPGPGARAARSSPTSGSPRTPSGRASTRCATRSCPCCAAARSSRPS